jgi:hypothetical protein
MSMSEEPVRLGVQMSAENQGLHWKHQGLDAQYRGMHYADRVHHVQEEPAHRTDLARRQFGMVVGVGVCDATAARRHTL